MVARPAPVNLSISLIAAPALQWYRIASICFRLSLPGRSVSSSLVVLIPPITARAQERRFVRLAVPLFHPFQSSVRYRCRLASSPRLSGNLDGLSKERAEVVLEEFLRRL